MLKAKENNMDVKNIIAENYKGIIQEASVSLEYEESSKVLANLQGRLSGAKKFMVLFREIFPMFREIKTLKDEEGKERLFNLKDISFEALNVIEKDLDSLVLSTEYAIMEKAVKETIEKKKAYLFYEAEKGRDLDFIHGFRDSYLSYRERIEAIRDKVESRKDEAPLFDGEI